MNRRFALVLVALLASGCDKVFGVHGTPDSGPADADIGSDTLDAAPADVCSSINMLSDTFATDDLAMQWPSSYASGGLDGRYVVQDNELQMMNVQPQGHVIIASPFFYDFRNQKFSFKFSDNGAIGAGSGQFVVGLDSSHFVYDTVNMVKRQRHLDIYRINNRLQARATGDDGSNAVFGDVDYDAIAHAYVRIGLEGTQVVFETSPDGSTWKSQGSTSYDGMDFVRVGFDLYRTPAGGEVAATISDIMGGVARTPACKMNTLVDTFDGTELKEQWGNSALNRGGVFIQDDLLHIVTPNYTQTGIVAIPLIASSLPYDLKDNELLVDVVKPLTPEPTKSISFATADYGVDELQMVLSNGRLAIIVSRTSGASNTQIYNQAYAPTTQHWWRIKNTAAGTSFDVSPDGKTWSMLALNTSALPPRAGLVTLSVSSSSSLPDDAQFDNVNSAPLP